MTTRVWQGQADATAQISNAGVTGPFDAATDYQMLVGGELIASKTGLAGSVPTASGLATDWNASAHPYATNITASTTGGGATVVLTKLERGNDVGSPACILTALSVLAACFVRCWEIVFDDEAEEDQDE